MPTPLTGHGYVMGFFPCHGWCAVSMQPMITMGTSHTLSQMPAMLCAKTYMNHSVYITYISTHAQAFLRAIFGSSTYSSPLTSFH